MKHYRKGIVFVHGIQGSPGQFGFLTEKAAKNVLIRNILLPGHGESTKEFQRADKEQWEKAVIDACRDISSQCDEVYYVGHSMGCLLGMLAEQKLKSLSGMLLICCPFYVFPTYRYWRNNFYALCIKGRSDDPFIRAGWEGNSVSAKHAVSYLFCTHPYMELFRLIRTVKNQKITLPSKTVFCYAERDEIVHRRSVSYTEQVLMKKTEVFPGSGHNYFTDEAKERLIQLMLDMIGSNKETEREAHMDNKQYRFYGWQNAAPEIRQLYDKLLGVWAADTCAPRLRGNWSPDNPTYGQCSITSFLVQDLYGGKVYGIRLPDGSYHCYNEACGSVFDLTSEQFGDEVLSYENNPEQFREDHFADEGKYQRYLLLKERFLNNN